MPRTKLEKQHSLFISSNVFYKFFLAVLIISSGLFCNLNFTVNKTYAKIPTVNTTPNTGSTPTVTVTPNMPWQAFVSTPETSLSTPSTSETPTVSSFEESTTIVVAGNQHQVSNMTTATTPDNTSTIGGPISSETPNQSEQTEETFSTETPGQHQIDTPAKLETPGYDETESMELSTPEVGDGGVEETTSVETPNHPQVLAMNTMSTPSSFLGAESSLQSTRETPDSNQESQTPRSSETPSRTTVDNSTQSETPDNLEVNTPTQSETPNNSETSTPTQSETPSSQENQALNESETPNNPESSTPTQNETPNNPEVSTPTQSETPDNPETDTPTQSETPNNPEVSTPTQSETPNNPEVNTPTQSETPDNSEDQAPNESETPNTDENQDLNSDETPSQPEDSNTDNSNNSGGSVSVGGNGPIVQLYRPSGGGYNPLIISNEKVEYITNGAVLITWKTNTHSTGQVRYGKTSAASSTSPLDSYKSSSVKMTAHITEHIMVISGLEYGVTYYFRPLSTSSIKKAVGKELTFTLPKISPSKNTTGVCKGGILENIRLGGENNPTEVRKLQNFLRDFENFENVSVTGIYDQASQEAVRIFQMKYAKEILTPWGATEPTGHVYITTRKKINEIICGSTISFSNDELSEIENYKKKIETLKSVEKENPGNESQVDQLEGLIGQDNNDNDNDKNIASVTTVGDSNDKGDGESENRTTSVAAIGFLSDNKLLYLLSTIILATSAMFSYPHLKKIAKKRD